MKLSFIWWNTSLSPVAKDRSTSDQKGFAQSMINFFTQDIRADLIALGEVKGNDISDIRNKCKISGYELIDGFQKAGKAYFDTCVLFKRDKFILLESRKIVANKGNRTFKIAQRLDFAIQGHNVPIHLLVSHWPSRLHSQQNNPNRDFFGMKLREVVEELIDINKDETSIILLGDYNDEPFDHPLSEHLMATRDRNLVMRKKHLLYNPFWRYLGQTSQYTHDTENQHDSGGTCFFKSESLSRWRTFDQIIFSSNFLGNSDWHLNEKLTQVIDIPIYRDIVLNPKEIFDHFPVMGVIERGECNG